MWVSGWILLQNFQQYFLIQFIYFNIFYGTSHYLVMSNSFVNLNGSFEAEELRAVLEDTLCINSILPCFMHGETGSSAHCILRIKPGEESSYNSTWVEHILCRVIRKLSRDEVDRTSADSDYNISSVKVTGMNITVYYNK